MIEIIPWSDFQNEIAEMWGVDNPISIPIINNPYRVIDYPLEQWRDEMLYFPIAFSEEGIIKGFTMFYNVSNSVIRVRGIYIKPEYRGAGAGHRMVEQGWNELFPASFTRLIGFYREEGVERFLRHGGMKVLEGSPKLWSDFSATHLRVLYRDRDDDKSTTSADFIREHRARFSAGGANNLATAWSASAWAEFAKPHAEVYPEVDLRRWVHKDVTSD